jgi:hypothetical protein
MYSEFFTEDEFINNKKNCLLWVFV